MRVLITRSAGDAQAAAAQLRAQGHDVLACPLISIEKTPDQKLSLAATQAFIVTDADGARALAESVGVRTFPVFCDSAGTAAELGRLGFGDARSADGDAPAIARLIERSLSPKLGGLVYACSTSAPINLSAMLGNAGFAARMTALYAVGRAEVLPRVIADALTGSALDAVVFFSAEEGRAFAQLVQRANLDGTTEKLIAIVAAPVVAAPLTVLKFARVVSAPKSDAASVMALVNDELLRQPEPQVIQSVVSLHEPTPEPEIIVPEPEIVVPLPPPVELFETEPTPIPEPEPEPEIVALEPFPVESIEAAPAPTPDPIAEVEPALLESPAGGEVVHKRGLLSALGALFARRAVPQDQKILPTEAQETPEAVESKVVETEPMGPTRPVEAVEPVSEIVEPAPVALEEPALPVPTVTPLAELIETIEPPISALTPEPVVESEPIAVDPPTTNGALRKKSLLAVLGSLVSRRTKARDTEAAIIEPAPIVAAETEPVSPEPAPAIEVVTEQIAESGAFESGAPDETPVPPIVEPERHVTEPQLNESKASQRESVLEKARRFFSPRPQPTPEVSATIDELPAVVASAESTEQLSPLEPETQPEPEPERSVTITEKAELEPPIEIVATPEPAAIEDAPRETEQSMVMVEDPPKPAEEELQPQKVSVWASVRALFARAEKTPDAALEQQPSTEPSAEQEAPEALEPPKAIEAPLPETAPPEPEFIAIPEPEPESKPEPAIVEPLPEIIAQEKSPQKESPLSTIPTVASNATPAIPEPPPAVAGTDVEQAIIKDNTPPPMSDVNESNERQEKDTETPRVARGGGRAARLLAEDAADARALHQRFKVPGGEPEPEAAETPSTTTTTESSMAGATLHSGAMARSSSGLPRVVYVVLAFIVIAVGVVVAEPTWISKLRSTPSASTSLEQPQSASVSAAPAADQLAALNARTDALAKDLAALNARLAAVEQRGAQAQGADTTAIEQRFAALETAAKAKSPDDLSTSVTNQARLLTNMSARIATLESGIGNIARVEDLATRLAALEGKSAEANSVLALSERVGAIEKRDSVAATALVVATAQLRDVVGRGRPYAVELETVIQLAKRANTNFDAEALMSAATKGLPRDDVLKASFPDMAAAAVRSGIVPGDTAGWFKRVLDRALSIVSLRPFGNVEGSTPGAILARAEQALRADNLAGAASELETLKDAPAQAATAWLAQAKARIAADRALEELASRSVGAMSALTQTKPAVPAP